MKETKNTIDLQPGILHCVEIWQRHLEPLLLQLCLNLQLLENNQHRKTYYWTHN